ncbi:hypothetical protein AAC387_Pa05g2801 [Persea americana]
MAFFAAHPSPPAVPPTVPFLLFLFFPCTPTRCTPSSSPAPPPACTLSFLFPLFLFFPIFSSLTCTQYDSTRSSSSTTFHLLHTLATSPALRSPESENIIPSTPTLAATIHALLAELLFLILGLYGDGMNDLGSVA